jgi:hypothetical protein
MQDADKTVGDIAAIAVTVATVTDLLPSIAAIFTIVWTAIRIYESKTVQRWLGRE